jgi:hypothetical protein
LIFDWLVCAFFGWGDPLPIHCGDCILQLKCLCTMLTKFVVKFHTNAHTHTLFQHSYCHFDTLWRMACALAQFSRCISMTGW